VGLGEQVDGVLDAHGEAACDGTGPDLDSKLLIFTGLYQPQRMIWVIPSE
jgi:hypothetical protein